MSLCSLLTEYAVEITHNACYDLVIEEKATYVYLKGNSVAAVA